MCLSPIKIKNPSLSWKEGDSKYIVVPCGRCAQCRAKAQQDWFIRGFYEYKNIKQQGGNVFAACLTYDNHYLPHFKDERDWIFNSKGEKVKAVNPIHYEFDGFDQHAILNFMKNFRIRFQRKYHFDAKGIKFFIACEFGSKTHRPHYHILVYIPIPSFHDGEFYDLIDHCWQFGYVSKDKKQSWRVKSYTAIQYATKYVTKDLFFFDKHVDEYLDKSQISDAEYDYRYSLVRNYLPKFHASQHFGERLAQEIESQNNPLDYLRQEKPVVIPKKNGKTVAYTVPKYILNKLTKYKDVEASELLGRPFFRHTQLGDDLARQRLLDRIEKDSITLKEYGDYNYLLSRMPKDNINISDWKYDWLCTSISDGVQHINHKELVKYRNFLRYLPIGDYEGQSAKLVFANFSNIVDNFFGNESIPFELYSIIREQSITMEQLNYKADAQVGLPLNDMEEASDIKVFAESPKFRKYEHLCRLLDDYDSLITSARYLAFKSKQDRKNEVRSAFSQYEEFGRFDEDFNKI